MHRTRPVRDIRLGGDILYSKFRACHIRTCTRSLALGRLRACGTVASRDMGAHPPPHSTPPSAASTARADNEGCFFVPLPVRSICKLGVQTKAAKLKGNKSAKKNAKGKVRYALPLAERYAINAAPAPRNIRENSCAAAHTDSHRTPGNIRRKYSESLVHCTALHSSQDTLGRSLLESAIADLIAD